MGNRQCGCTLARHEPRMVEHAWDGHLDRHFAGSQADFMTKVERTLGLIRERVPPCCQAAAED